METESGGYVGPAKPRRKVRHNADAICPNGRFGQNGRFGRRDTPGSANVATPHGAPAGSVA